MERDDFIAAMIAELGKQKVSIAKGEQFFTGTGVTAEDVFQKLCFDFPDVDELMLDIFLSSIKRWGTGDQRDSFQSAFCLHEKMLYNLSNLHDAARPDRYQELTGCLAAELYLSLPLRMVDLPLPQLSSLLCCECTPSAVLEGYRAHLLGMSLSQMASSLSAAYLLEGQHLSSALGLLGRLVCLRDRMAAWPQGQRPSPSPAPGHLLQLIEHISAADPDAWEAELEGRLLWLREVIAQLSRAAGAILCAFPALLPGAFAEYCRVHLGQVDPFSPRTMPSLGQYLLLLGLGQLSSALAPRPSASASISPSPTQRAALDAIRAYFTAGAHLQEVVDICSLVSRCNGYTSEGVQLDLEAAGFLSDLALLLLPADRAVPSLVEAVLSSRLLADLLQAQARTMQAYLADDDVHSNTHNKQEALRWELSVKLSLAVSRLALLDAKVPAFALGYPPLAKAWPALLEHMQRPDSEQALLNRGTWRLSLGTVALAAMLVKHHAHRGATRPDTPLLISVVLAGMDMAVREIAQVQDVLTVLLERGQRERIIEQMEAAAGGASPPEAEKDSKSPAPVLGDAVAAVSAAPLHQGHLIANYQRTLEGLEVSCAALCREDLPFLLVALKRDEQMSAFLTSYLAAWTAVLKALTASKAKLHAEGDAQQVLANALDRCIRMVKSTVSLLEGGATSKSD